MVILYTLTNTIVNIQNVMIILYTLQGMNTYRHSCESVGVYRACFWRLRNNTAHRIAQHSIALNVFIMKCLMFYV